MIFFTRHEQHKEHNGKECEIIRPLTPQEADEEVGTMYRIRFSDDTEIDAFQDEVYVPIS